MTRRFTILCLVMLCPILLTDCASAKLANQLRLHNENLTKAAFGDINPEKKLDILVISMVGMMYEALKPLNPKKGVAYVTDYGKENGEAIEKILKDFGEWQKELSVGERIALGIRIAKKPYMKELIELGPRFKKKYKQVKFLMKLTGKLNKGLFDLGVKQLEL
ncbi:MAG: hypothetical protein AAF502_25025 [Bacteroidota bacterium]